MLGQIDGGERVSRADMHDHGNAAFYPVDDLLGDFLALVDLHDQPAMGAEGKKSMHAGIHVEVDDRIGRFVVDGAVMFERHRHGHQYAFNLSIARHKCSFRYALRLLIMANP